MEKMPYFISRGKRILFLSFSVLLFILLFRSYIAALNMWRGEEYFVSRQVDKSIIAFKKALILAPNNARAHSALAWIYSKAGMKEAAKSEYLKATALGSKEADAYFELAMIYYKDGDFELAIKNFNQAALNDKDHLPSRIMLALALEKSGDRKEALHLWEEIRKNFPRAKIALSHIERLKQLIRE